MAGAKKTITFVTSNLNKLAEVSAILSDYHIKHVNLDLREIQGDHREIAIDKCLQAFQSLKSDVIIEDTSLRFNAMNGLPGPYVKDFLRQIGCDGLHKMLASFDDKSAQAVCVFAYLPADATPEANEVLLFEGFCDGNIVAPRYGATKAFGWDPCFEPVNSEETFAQMSSDAKNAISHRSRALKSLQQHFQH
ncbi:Inosine triphosphate pyrophosphatase [Aphelenchoides besseyi]|nr:Inosine triphosphate pyrophosphatase [Aphelenchoides besseyi]KAI6202092.1 Inosine triphosphate pyrophosphatase [Aphelenchoides besseyi]